MANVEFIEREIDRPGDGSFARLRDWFIEYDHSRWDRPIEEDAAAGGLDSLIEEALAEHREGKTR